MCMFCIAPDANYNYNINYNYKNKYKYKYNINIKYRYKQVWDFSGFYPGEFPLFCQKMKNSVEML